jgi:hypothetical protein
MGVLLESIVIGCYLSFLFCFVSMFIQSFFIAVFISGFVKHYIGYYSGLERYFYLHSCSRFHIQPIKKGHNTLPWKELITQSVMEGCVITSIAYLFSILLDDRLIIVFTTGVFIHWVAEIMDIHEQFCMNYFM